MASGRRRVNFTSKNRKMQMKDLLVGLLHWQIAREGSARATWRPRWSSNFPFLSVSFLLSLLLSSTGEPEEEEERKKKKKKEKSGKRERKKEAGTRERARERESVRLGHSVEWSLAAGHKNVLIICCRGSSSPWCR